MSYKENQETLFTNTVEFDGAVTFDSTVKAPKAQPLPDVEVTATTDGLTTGLIPQGARFVSVTSANAAHIITLPAGDAEFVGTSVRGWVGANGCEMRTPATSGATINGVDSDGTNEAALPATTMFEATLVAADTWILRAWDEGGDDIAAPVPDAA